jgi:hypothetical protein
VKDINEILTKPESEQEWNGKNKATMMKAIVHAVDISNSTRDFDIAEKWAKSIVKEFFYQGDRERILGYEITMLCDRHTSNFANG